MKATETTLGEAITDFVNREKMEKAAEALFSTMLEHELSEAECVSTIALVLCMRLAYASRDIDQLLAKLETFPGIFLHYARANLSTAQSAILAKEAAIKEMH